jgi:hypothetical protein
MRVGAVEIEVVPDAGADDVAARAALAALEGELVAARGAGDGDWSLVPHSDAWRIAAVADAVARGASFESGQARPVRSTRGATRA